MLRRANDHETAAFELVERTVQRTRPRVGPLGLKALELPGGRIEKNPLGVLRFRSEQTGSEAPVDNLFPGRRLSPEESSLWRGLQRVLAATTPVVDSEWNLVSMQIGARTLTRLPLGSVVTNHPKGTPPFQGSFDLSKIGQRPRPDLESSRVQALFEAIDAFLAATEPPQAVAPPAPDDWKRVSAAYPYGGSRASALLGRAHHRARGKWHKCPLCHAPVVHGPFNPRIPSGSARRPSAPIRDLRGGYLSFLRDTYLMAEPAGLFVDPGTRPEPRDAGGTDSDSVQS